MRSRQTPSGDTFLVRTKDRAQPTPERLESLGSVEPAEEAGGVLVRLRVQKSKGDAKAAWQSLQAEAGNAEVDPVLVDETGQPHFPTGTVTVRFNRAPSPAFLNNFAKKFGVELLARNEYVPAQVTFKSSSRQYLPELLETLKTGKGVSEAWANTKSRYRRA